MKIDKIKNIKAYKSFKDFSWQRYFNKEKFHETFNVLYGENGSGKSSICNILKSVSQNKDFIKYEPNITSLYFDSIEYKYSNSSWNNKNINKESLLFFDREFVDRNVHLGHKRDTTKDGQEQESGKMIIEFDNNAINLRMKRDDARKLKEEQEIKIKEFKESNKEILNFNILNEEFELYKRYKNKTNKEIYEIKKSLIKNKEEINKILEVDKKSLKNVQNIKNDIKEIEYNISNISLSKYEIYQAIFIYNLDGQIEIEAERTLINKIRHNKSFFETGFKIRNTYPNQCPFCQSKDKEENIKEIIKIYNQIYDDTYQLKMKNFEHDKQSIINELESIIICINNFDLNSIFLELKRLDENYKIKNIYSVEDEKKYKKPAIRQIKNLLDKISTLNKPNNEIIRTLYEDIEKEFQAVEQFFQNIINYISQKNQIISEFKIENTDEKLLTRINENNEKIEDIEKQLNLIVSDKIEKQKNKEKKEEGLHSFETILTNLKSEYDKILNTYENYCSSEVFKILLKKIEDYFKHFNFCFKLELKTEKSGKKSEFPFAFKLLDKECMERDFSEGLSEGELQVLSICFFFAFLDIQKNKDQKILIFDDPITSLDNSNLSCLVDLIAEKEKDYSQIFVFTHHRLFFKFLRKKFKTDYTNNSNGNEYNILRNKDEFGGSFICKSKSDKFIQKLKDFESHLQIIPIKSIDIELKIVEYGQYLRYEIERFIKNILLHWNSKDFAEAIDGIKNNKKIEDKDLEKIKKVYSFCNWTTSHVAVGDDHGLSQLKDKINVFIDIFEKYRKVY